MKSTSLKIRFGRTIFAVYIVSGLLIYLAFHLVTTKIVRQLGTDFAVKEALLQKSKMLSAIQPDLSLSLKMADSPFLKRWAQNENNPNLRKLAFEELESYRKSFDGKSLFFAINRSRHYYFADGTSAGGFRRPRYTLSPSNVNDAWYFRTIKDAKNFELNIDYDNHLKITKIWFNVILRDRRHHPLGMGGSGIDITDFIRNIVNSGDKGTETILFRRDGAITGSRDQQYVLHNSKVRGTAKMTTIYDLVDTAAKRVELRKTLAALAASGPQAKTLYLTLGGKSYLAAISYLKEIHWFDLVLVDPAQYVSSRDFLPILAVLILSSLAVVLILGFLLNRLVLAPLSGLAKSSDEIARGNFNTRIPVRSNDEIGSLTRSFNIMTEMVRDYTQNLETKVKERTEDLARSNRKLADSNQQILSSIRFARSIQASILPNEPDVQKEIDDLFVLYLPRDIVGGDFYYFRKTPGGCFLALIDCTGHGVPGAFMTMTAKAVLDRILDSAPHADPAEVLREYNRLLKETLHQGKNDTLVDNGLEIGLCRWIPGQDGMLFAGARIDLLSVSEGRLEKIAGDKQAIGYQRSDIHFSYTNHTIPRVKGTPFYLASDGILDQAGGEKGWGFGRRRLHHLLEKISRLPAEEQKTAIEQKLALYQGKTPQRDDITVIGFRL